MILLQAAMAAGFILLLIFVTYFIVGVLVLMKLLMNVYWRLAGKKEHIANKLPYYKDPIAFLINLILAVSILIVGFDLLIILFDKLFPAFGYAN